MNEIIKETIFESDTYAAHYVGPPLSNIEQVCVAFPERTFPEGFEGPGFGERFFVKRGIPYVSVRFRKVFWYQEAGFFDAMHAIRSWLGPNVKVSTYGTSMGGYGAVLATRALKATRCVAMCPQFSIDPKVVPFERRFIENSNEIGSFRYDVSANMDADTHYILLFDPSHPNDRRQARLFPKQKYWSYVPTVGFGHAVLPTLVDLKLTDNLAKLVTGEISAGVMRSDIRKVRDNSFQYLRRMTNLVGDRTSARMRFMLAKLNANGHAGYVHRLIAKRTKKRQLPHIVLHAGLPEFGSIALQKHLTKIAPDLQRRDIIYPTDEGQPNKVSNQNWISQKLKKGKIRALKRTLRSIPSGTQKFILSDEAMLLSISDMSENMKYEFQKALSGFDVTVVTISPNKSHQQNGTVQFPIDKSDFSNAAGLPHSDNLSNVPSRDKKLYARQGIETQINLDDLCAALCQLSGAIQMVRIEQDLDQDIVADFFKHLGLPDQKLLKMK